MVSSLHSAQRTLAVLFLISSLLAGVRGHRNLHNTRLRQRGSSPTSASASSRASASGNDGQARAVGQVRVTEGRGSVAARAEADVYTEALIVIEASVNNVFAAFRNDDNVAGTIESETVAIGRVVAEAYASTLVIANVDGTGVACGAAAASAQTSASLIVTAFFDAIRLPQNGGPNANVNEAERETLTVTAEAFAVARSVACTSGGSVIAAQESLASTITYIFQGVLTRLLSVEDDPIAESRSFVEGTGNSAAESDGNAGAAVTTVPGSPSVSPSPSSSPVSPSPSATPSPSSSPVSPSPSATPSPNPLPASGSPSTSPSTSPSPSSSPVSPSPSASPSPSSSPISPKPSATPSPNPLPAGGSPSTSPSPSASPVRPSPSVTPSPSSSPVDPSPSQEPKNKSKSNNSGLLDDIKLSWEGHDDPLFAAEGEHPYEYYDYYYGGRKLLAN